MKYSFYYSQPRPASYDLSKAIHESRTHDIEADDKSAAHDIAADFLRQGAVRCGGTLYRRAQISPLTELPLVSNHIIEPKPEFLPCDEYF